MRKCRTAVAINCSKLYNTTCIVHGYVYKNTICYSTELNKKERDPVRGFRDKG